MEAKPKLANAACGEQMDNVRGQKPNSVAKLMRLGGTKVVCTVLWRSKECSRFLAGTTGDD